MMGRKKRGALKSKRNTRSLKRVKSAPEFARREVMSRPERSSYVRKEVKPAGCVFCLSREEGVGIDSLCLFKGERAMVIVNKFPYNSGHVMVLPTRHCGDMTELTSEEYAEMQNLLRKTVEIVKHEYQCEGLNIGVNMGRSAGAGIPDHLHWHVIPRWFGDTNFFPLIAGTKVVLETPEQSFNRLKGHFKQVIF